jgi:methylated-DNA-[protein]-cysteine S-methyltransferase
VARKQRVLELLANRDLDGFSTWMAEDGSPAAVLVSLLFVNDELLRWRAIEALGKLMGAKAQDDPEFVRDYLRRLFWSMNDESGSVIWNAPEAIGEILAQAPDLAHEYTLQLLSILHEEPFERGAHWAVARLAKVRPDAFTEGAEMLTDSLADPDPTIRGLAASALLAIDAKSSRRAVEALQNDESPVTEYDFHSGQLKRTTVGRMIEKAIAGADSPDRAA